MKQINQIFSVAVVACALATGCSKNKTEENAPVTMKLKWQVGKRYDQEMIMNQNSHIQIPGMQQAMDQGLIMTQGFSVSGLKTIADGGMDLELKFTSQKMTSKMNGQTVTDFDSTKDSSKENNDPSAAIFGKMVGAHLTFVLDADGKIVKTEGLDDFISQVSGGDPKSAAMFKGMMTEDTLKELVTRGRGLPEKPVKIGDSWPVNVEENAGQVGMMTMNLTYTFKDWEEHDGQKCAMMDFTGTVSSKPQADAGPVQVSIQKGSVTGKMWYAPALNMVMETTSDQKMTLSINAQGKSIESQMQQAIGTKIVKISDLEK